MARKILVADRDPVYAEALAKRIRKHCPACDVTTASDEPTFQNELAQAGGNLSLVVSAAHFPIDGLPSGVSQLILLETRLGVDTAATPGLPVRLGPVQPILERLDDSGCSLAEAAHEPDPAGSIQAHMKPANPSSAAAGAASALASLAATDTPEAVVCTATVVADMATAVVGTATPVADKAAESGRAAGADEPSVAPAVTIASKGIQAVVQQTVAQEKPLADQRVILMLTQTVTGRHASYADQRCLELGANGEIIGYLPLMPNYYCRFATGSGSGSGFGLTNLILRIACGGMPASELGAYMAVDSLGRMQVRPSDRADDLLDCQPHPAFQLVMQLREWTLKEPHALLVIEAAGVPFRLMQAIVPLCDAVEVIMPEDEGYAGQALRREIGDVLTELPPGARVRQVAERQISGRPVARTPAGTVANPAAGHATGSAAAGRETSRGRHVPA